MQQCSDQFIMTAWRPLSETHGWSRYNTFYSWGVLESDQTWVIDVPILSTRDEWRVSEWSDVDYWCSNTLHSRWVKSIREWSDVDYWCSNTLHSRWVKSIREWSDVDYWCSNTLHSRWVKSIREWSDVDYWRWMKTYSDTLQSRYLNL
jgi:hypothetical protein